MDKVTVIVVALCVVVIGVAIIFGTDLLQPSSEPPPTPMPK